LTLFIAVVLMAGGCSSQRPQSKAPPSFVYVRGEFRNPGRYPWTNGITAMDAVHQAGGFTDFALPALIIVHWDHSRESYVLTPELQITNDIPLKPGDQVVNPRQ
jgi:polysaccharide export outer membrane protein